MVLGTSEVELRYNEYMEDPTEENLKAFIRSNPRDPNEAIQKDVYLERIQESRLSWDKRLEKRLSEKKNRILIYLCQDHSINHISGNNKFQLVQKLVSHFQEQPGEWELKYSSDKRKFVITNNGNLVPQIKGELREMSSQNIEKKENVITNTNEDQEDVMTNPEKKENVITKKKKDTYLHLRISTEKKSKIQEKADQAGYKSVSKYIIDVMTNSKNVITTEETKIETNMKHRLLHDKLDTLEKDHKLLLKFIKIFFQKRIETDEDDLTEEDIDLIKKYSEDALKNA